jgi:uncharacterized protein (TIGR00299 family) protein
MKTAYFDCSSGIAGNMIIGALLDAGLKPSYLKETLGNLRMNFAVPQPRPKRGNRDVQSQVPERLLNYRLHITKTKRGNLAGTYFNVDLKGHDHHRGLNDILKIIKKSELSKDVKELSSRIFKRLAQAEAKVHGLPINQVHFHEVGAVDAIIDIVGTCIGLEKLGIEQVFCSPLPFGKGKIRHAHGVLPNPAPTTAELLKGVPIYQENVKGELVTPTGAAIITTIASGFTDLPRIELEATGSGAGSRKFPDLPGFLTVHIGESLVPSARDAVVQIETSIDDMAPKDFNKVIAALMKAGALDAYTIPVTMKKQRTGTQLVVLCSPDIRHPIVTRIFELTPTFGVRTFLVPRETLSRKFKKVRTKYGQARIKIGSLGLRPVTAAPEFEDYKRLAKKHHIPIQKAYKEIRKCS